MLLGRKVRGCEEVELIADLADLTDRDAVARGLMQQEEFTGHWAEVLVDNMRVDRVGTKSQQACYGPAQRSNIDSALASHILSSDPSTPAPGGAFNMSDVLQAAVELDNLMPIYRAHLFAMQSRPTNDFEPQRRADLGLTFGEVFLNRQIGCLTCHNSDESLSGEGSGWDRTWAIWGSFEKALYGSSVGTDPVDAHGVFNTAVIGGIAPWGMNSCGSFDSTITGSGSSAYFAGPLGDTASIFDLVEKLREGYVGLETDGLERSLNAQTKTQCDFCSTSCTGTTPADPMTAPNAAFVESTLTTACGSCHGAIQDLYFVGYGAGQTWYTNSLGVPSTSYQGLRIDPGNGASSILVGKLRPDSSDPTKALIGGSRMPAGGPYLSAADIDKIENWIDNLGSSTACAGCDSIDCFPRDVDGAEAFAYLTAATIAELAWEEAMGYPVTIPNYFPRNIDQRRVLWHLTEDIFVPTSWSLRELLAFIVTADTFNRRAPFENTGTTAYELPMIYDPWVEADPRTCPVNEPECTPPQPAGSYDPNASPEDHHNSVGDAVYRYRATHLLESTHASLGWAEPSRFPQPSYPNLEFQRALGQYLSSQEPGFKSVDFGGLLAWETTHGACQNPDGGADWINALATEAKSFAAAPPDGLGILTVQDVVRVERDWLLSDGGFNTTAPTATSGMSSLNETDAIAALIAPLTLSGDVNNVSDADLQDALRKVCGAMLQSPQYLLAGIATNDTCADTRLRVCDGGPCTYQEMCTQIAGKIDVGSSSIICNEDSVSLVNPTDLMPPWQRFCPAGWCGFLSRRFQGDCADNLPGCGFGVPYCDPRCTGAGCCGGLPRFNRDGVFVAWADGGAINKARGVSVLRADANEVTPLREGDSLHYGDTVVIAPEGALSVEAVQTVMADRVSRVRGHDVPAAADFGDHKTARGKTRRTKVRMEYDGSETPADRPIYMVVSGPPILDVLHEPQRAPRHTPENIRWLQEDGWLAHGEAGVVTLVDPAGGGISDEERTYMRQLAEFKKGRKLDNLAADTDEVK